MATMIQGMFRGNALPVLTRLVQFTESRHKVLSHSIANASTPYFKPTDLDPAGFQATLSQAIEERRKRVNPVGGPLEVRRTDQLRFHENGITAFPQASNNGVLFHDQNNRDLERMMQHLAENTLAHSAGIEMIRNQFTMLETAISERV